MSGEPGRVWIGDMPQLKADGRPTCQCGKGDTGCLASIEQEDLLCDTCRRGCEVWSGGHWQFIGTFNGFGAVPAGVTK
jgi:hypothetical protein